MPNLIQIKRSLTTATPLSLANGEQAYSSNGDVLYIGANGAVVAIGGKRNPGVLTANQALVANSTSYIDVIKTANLYLGTTTVNAINAIANSTALGAASNNELVTSWAVKNYVDQSISFTVTNNSTNSQVMFNDSGVVAGDAGFTYNKTTDTLTVVNATFSAVVGSGIINATADNWYANSTVFTIGNTTVNSSLTDISLTVGSAAVTNATGFYHTGTINAASHTVGTSVVANSIGITTSGFVNAVGVVNASSHTVGSNFIANSIGITTTGYANVATTLAAGNTTITGFANVVGDTAALRVGNTTNYFAGNTSGIYPTSNSVGNALGSGTQRWSIWGTSASITGSVSGITTLAAGNTTITGFVNATSSVNSAILSVGTSFIANTLGAYHTGTVNAASHTVGTAFVANSLGVTTTGYANVATTLAAGNTTVTGFVNATSSVNSAILAVGTTFIANTTKLTFTGANVDFATSTTRLGNTTISGDLTVSGTLTTVDTINLTVTDSLIRLATEQADTATYTDALDIGFYGVYGNTSVTRYAGMARDSATGEFVLFVDGTVAPDNAGVATTGPLGTLYSYLKSGGLVSNSTAVTLTANSTLAVNITANTITLSTPLATTSGGTGLNTYTSGDILVGNSSNLLSKLSLGGDGKILQSNGTALVYSDLDGGTF